MDSAITTALLGLIASLIGGMIWTVKALMRRSDDLMAARDRQIESAIRELRGAVLAFGRFEKSEGEVHTALEARLSALADTQQAILELQERILAKVNGCKKVEA